MYIIGFVDLEFIIIPTYNCSITKNGGRNDNILKTINVLSNNSPSRLNKPEKIRLFISGSAPLLEETFHEFYQRTNHQILERYGMTETNMNTSNPLKGDRKSGTVGLPLEDVQVKVVDENDATLPQGEIGNIQIKGPNVFKGYWKMPENRL